MFYSKTIKLSIPETGRGLRLEGDNAFVLLKDGKSCKGYGAGKLGLCKPGGSTMKLTAKKLAGARIGDTVRIGVEKKLQRKGYFLAYILPLISFIAGAFAGHIAGQYLNIQWLDAVTAFAALSLLLMCSARKLKSPDFESRMAVNKILSENIFREEPVSDKERWHLNNADSRQ